MFSHGKTEPLSTKENTLWNAFGCLFYLGCQWLITVLVVLLSSGYDNSGILAYAMSIGNMFASVSLYKIRTFQVSDINNRFSPNNYIALRLFTVAVSFIASGVYLVATTNNTDMIIATLLYLVFKADETFSDVLYGIEQKNQRMDYIGKSQIIRGFVSLIGFVVPLTLTGSLPFAIMGMCTLCMMVTLFFDIPHAKLFGSVTPRINKQSLVSLLKACLLPTVANLFATSIVSVARQQYGILQGETLLGIYASIATPAVLIQAATNYLYSPLIGQLASSLYNRGISAYKRSYLKVLTLLIICMGILVAGLSVVGAPLLTMVYGESIASYTWLFPYVLMATTSIGVLLYVNDSLLILRDGIAQVMLNACAIGIVALCAAFFISQWDMNGINLVIASACIPGILLGSLRILLKKELPHQAPDGKSC